MTNFNLFWWIFFIVVVLLFSLFVTWVSVDWLKKDLARTNDNRKRTFKSYTTYRVLFVVFLIPYVNLVFWVLYMAYELCGGSINILRDVPGWYRKNIEIFFKSDK
jgi:hypothetical protein